MIRSVQMRHDVGMVFWNSKDDAVTLDPRTAAVLALGEAEIVWERATQRHTIERTVESGEAQMRATRARLLAHAEARAADTEPGT